jgi:NAD(P)-dependent dehydrogenase (short-subunit alcohol dehydrogenase family)
MSPDNTRLLGRTALVTGSTGGLGVGIAAALADAGAFVVISGRREARGVDVVHRIESRGGKATFIQADLATGVADISRLAEQAQAAAGGTVDILANNAAILLMPTPTAQVREQVIHEAFAINVIAPFLLTGLIAPDEYGPFGVRVNTVAPGPTLTERNAEFAERIGPMLQRIPSRRVSTVAEVAAAVVFLASDDAANIHGATLSVAVAGLPFSSRSSLNFAVVQDDVFGCAMLPTGLRPLLSGWAAVPLWLSCPAVASAAFCGTPSGATPLGTALRPARNSPRRSQNRTGMSAPARSGSRW